MAVDDHQGRSPRLSLLIAQDTQMSDNHYDVIIIGSGAAGCVVADYLARHTDKTIAVLEAGPMDRNPMIHIPAGYSKLLAKDTAVWPYETVPVNGERRRFRMGKVVGGGTSVNAMCYVRGQKQDFDAWQKAVGDEGDWSWEPCARTISSRKGTTRSITSITALTARFRSSCQRALTS